MLSLRGENKWSRLEIRHPNLFAAQCPAFTNPILVPTPTARSHGMLQPISGLPGFHLATFWSMPCKKSWRMLPAGSFVWRRNVFHSRILRTLGNATKKAADW